jgi:hypothetical protein
VIFLAAFAEGSLAYSLPRDSLAVGVGELRADCATRADQGLRGRSTRVPGAPVPTAVWKGSRCVPTGGGTTPARRALTSL